ncbi:MAG TPA: DUF4382 domain-containing protein [Steroidobacteraceae bacterium]|nr:DUF4382 domain-containing protein [Steroidobacteraceae bacterium]
MSAASDSSGAGATAQSGNVAMLLSDASSDDWATIGVKVLSIALVPQGGGSAVTVYTAASAAPMINLVQLDQLAEILANVSVPAGTYTGAVLTVSGNASDILLTVSQDPEAGFAGAPGATIPATQIQVQGAQGSTSARTVPVNVTFVAPLVVTAGQESALDLEVDLSHPVFIVAHSPPAAGGATLWAVDFRGPVRQRPIADIGRLVLRHTYGSVGSIASDGSSLTITKVLPILPLTSPESAQSTGKTLSIDCDAANGTLFYDVDAGTASTIKSFTSVAADLPAGAYVRIAARYQEDGSLTATRIWASSSFNSVWLSPEGHVVHVDMARDEITILDGAGIPVPVSVTADTQFFFHGALNTTAIGTGPGFLANLVRGFKVHVSVVDPLAVPLVAQSVDIETATFSGKVSLATASGLTYTHAYLRGADDYGLALPYISSSSANGKDAQGNQLLGFKYWDFAYPTLVTSGPSAPTDFAAAVGGDSSTGVSFAGANIFAYGASYARWGDAASPSDWSLPWVVLAPTPLPLGTVTTGLANDAFTMTVLGGSMPGTVDVSTSAGSATLVYQVDRMGGVITISAIDITTASGLTALTNGLTLGAPVKVYGIPQSDGTLRAYVLAYFTGDVMPAQ